MKYIKLFVFSLLFINTCYSASENVNREESDGFKKASESVAKIWAEFSEKKEFSLSE